jgi:hypothetical protein
VQGEHRASLKLDDANPNKAESTVQGEHRAIRWTSKVR